MVDLEDPVTLINAHLPPQIKVMAVKKVTKSFDSRYACGGRMYEYVMPTYTFAPYHSSTADYRMPGQVMCTWLPPLVMWLSFQTAQWSRWTTYCSILWGHTIIIISQVERSTRTCPRTGTSYPSRSVYAVAGCSWEVDVVQAGERFVSRSEDGKDMEFIPLRVKGQSFLLHQIRKMIGECNKQSGNLESEGFLFCLYGWLLNIISI